jgi:hypothetical protein
MGVRDYKIYFINSDLEPHLEEAYQYYKDDYEKSKRREKTYYIRSLKYFKILKSVYRGTKFKKLAEVHGVAPETIRTQCLKTQNKIATYIKLKQLGRL